MKPDSSQSHFFTDGKNVSKNPLHTHFTEHLEYNLVKDKLSVTPYDIMKAVSYTIKNRLIRDWLRTSLKYNETNEKKIYS